MSHQDTAFSEPYCDDRYQKTSIASIKTPIPFNDIGACFCHVKFRSIFSFLAQNRRFITHKNLDRFFDAFLLPKISGCFFDRFRTLEYHLSVFHVFTSQNLDPFLESVAVTILRFA